LSLTIKSRSLRGGDATPKLFWVEWAKAAARDNIHLMNKALDIEMLDLSIPNTNITKVGKLSTLHAKHIKHAE